MSRLSPPVAGALALAIASTLTALAGITAANASPSASPNAGQVIAQGVLYDADGSRADAGQTVTLTAWPTSKVLAGLADGAPVPTLTAGVAVTDASGAFAVRYSDPAALTSYADTDGTVDFTLDSDAGGVPHSFSLSRTLPAADASAKSAVAGARDAGGESPIELRSVPGAGEAPEATQRSAVVANAVPCGWLKLSTLGPRWVDVGSAYTAAGVSAKLTYIAGASSSISVGVSATGAGTYSASGAVTVSSSATVGFTPVSGVAGRVWRTQFVFAKFGYKCGSAPYSTYKVQAVSFAGGASYTTPGVAPTATYCVVQLANTEFTLDKSVSTSYSAATSPDIGINLKATTGYSTSTKLLFTFTSGKRLCGVTGYPGGTPGRLVAKV